MILLLNKGLDEECRKQFPPKESRRSMRADDGRFLL